MSYPESHYLSPIWRDGLFSKQSNCHAQMATGRRRRHAANHKLLLDGKVAFITGGNGTICSMQARALVRLGANACIIGRNVEKTDKAAKDIAAVRPGAKVIGIGACDVRNVRRNPVHLGDTFGS
jgi:peroxisomal 2,4-dienoyl-CoA reductase